MTRSRPLGGMTSACLALHLLVKVGQARRSHERAYLVMRPTPHVLRNCNKLSQSEFYVRLFLAIQPWYDAWVVERSICDRSLSFGGFYAPRYYRLRSHRDISRIDGIARWLRRLSIAFIRTTDSAATPMSARSHYHGQGETLLHRHRRQLCAHLSRTKFPNGDT